MNTKHHVSLKSFAESKTNGVQKTTQFKINPRLIEVEEGFNARPLNREHVEAMKVSFKAGATFPPVLVRVVEGKIILVDGHHRTAAFNELMDEGTEIVGVDAIQFRGNDADRVAHMLTSAQGLALTPLEMGMSYRRLIAFGWSTKQIAEKVGKTVFHVSEMIKLAESNSDVHKLITSKQVSSTTAAKMVREHGDKAGDVMNKALVLSGKVKITPKDVKSDTTTLVKAIREEMQSEGSVRAEDRCPAYAGLITYLRSTGA